MELYNQAIEVDEKSIPAHIGLGKVYMFFGNCDAAAQQYLKVLSLDSQNTDALEEQLMCGEMNTN